MTRPEADDLFREYARSRDHAVMARLVEENLPLSQAVARKFQGQGVEKDDLEQVAAMALMQAIERFDPERGLQFSTFALPTIAGSVRNYLRDRGGTIRLTRSLREQLTKLRRVSDELTRKLQREPSMRELAEAMELPPEELLTLLDARRAAQTVSLDAETSDDAEAPRLETFLGRLDEGYEQVEQAQWLNWVYGQVTPTEKLLLQKRFEERLGQRETARALGVSQMPADAAAGENDGGSAVIPAIGYRGKENASIMNDQNQRVYMGNDDAGNPIYGEYVGSDAVGNPIFGVFQGYDAYKQPVFSGICGQDEQGRPIWDTMGFNEQGQLVYGIPAVYDVNGNPLPQPAEQTPGGFTEAGKEPGKVRPRLHITPLMVMIMLAVIGLTAWFCYEQFAPQAARYGAIELASINATHTGDALIARNEAPYTADGVTSITYIAEEGSEVAQETRICQVYSAGFSTREVTTLQSYQEEIRDYQKDLITSAISDARMDRLMSEVTGHLRELREMIWSNTGSLDNQETLLKASIKTRQEQIKTTYADDQRFSRKLDDEISQQQRINSWTKDFTSNYVGIVSFYLDGYEYALTSQTYQSFTPTQVRQMVRGQVPDQDDALRGKTTLYRIVQNGSWNVLFLSADKDWNPVNGQTYQLKLGRFDSTQVSATVESFSRSGGELLVRLRVESDVHPVLYMRSTEATLGENMDTFRVPERALYVQNETQGIVVVEGQTESFHPISVLTKADGYIYFQPVQQGLLYEGLTVKLF